MAESREFVSFWNGKPLGFLEKLSLASFVKQGFSVSLYSYTPLDVPPGVTLRGAGSVVPRAEMFANPREKHSFAGFSNIFRYAILQQMEAVWIDADVLCWNWHLEGNRYIYGIEDRHGKINGAVLAAPQDSLFLQELQNRAAAIDRTNFRWGQLGPRLISKTVADLELAEHTLPRSALYHLDLHAIWRIWDPRETESLHAELESSSAIHLWNNIILNAAPSLANSAPPRGSLMFEIAQKAGVDLPDQSVTPEWVRDVARKGFVRYKNLVPRVKRRLKYRLR